LQERWWTALKKLCPVTDKLIHESQDSAQEHADALQAEDGKPRIVYRCRDCKKFHVSHKQLSVLSKLALEINAANPANFINRNKKGQ
jgi:hypothetical protein